MIDQRLDLLTDWLVHFFGNKDYTINNASGSADASFCRYFRIKCDDNTFIAMDAPPEKEDSNTFIKIATLLRINNLHTPKIFASNLVKGFLLLEDLGSTTFLQAINKNNRINLYKKAINEIVKFQEIDCKINNLPYYDDALLKSDMQLLVDWYLTKDARNNYKQQLLSIFDILSNNAVNSPQVFVHRDYHARNLMVIKGKLSIIDFQDALIGSNTYDLCSLLKDAYFELSENDIHTLLNYYYMKSNIKIEIEFSQFKKQFELMGLQRHLKILGIFKRLSIRDGKHQYLNDIPLVKKYILQIANKYPEFSVLKGIL